MTAGPRGGGRERRRSRQCRAIQRRLVFLEELPEAEAAALQAHLGVCRDCGRTERLLRGLLAAIRDMPAPAPEDAYWDRMAEAIMARIRAAPPPWMDQSSAVE
jgi:bacterioferritin-associated ferredoxin